jgi:hypothetical protein
MPEEPKPLTYSARLRDLTRRLATLERVGGHPAVDPTARSTAVAAATAVSTKNRVYRQATEPTDGPFVSGDIWFDTDNGNRPYVWQLVSGQLTTSGSTGGQGVLTTVGTGQLQDVALAANTLYYVSVRVKWVSGAAVLLQVHDTADDITVESSSTTEAAWTERTAQITTGAATPAKLTIAIKTDPADPQVSVFLADALSVSTSVGGTNLLANGGFEEGLGDWTTVGLLVNTGAALEFNRTDAYSGAWVDAQDAAILEASGNKIFRQAAEPSAATQGPFSNGDLWFDTDDKNKPYVYENGAWVSVRDQVADDALDKADDALTTANGKNRIFYRTTQPPPDSIPFVNGDLWFDTDDGNKLYTYLNGSWVSARDSEIATALSTSSNALSVAGGKNKVFVQSFAPTATATGDNWIDTSTPAMVIKGWTGSAWVTLGVDSSKISGTITSGQIGSLEGSKISGTLASTVTIPGVTYIDAAVTSRLAAGVVVAGSIKANAVDAAAIAANAVIAEKIKAGEVIAGKLAGDSVAANNIQAYAMTAKNFYTASTGNKIIIGPDAVYTEPRIVFDRDGTGASANDASIRGASTGLIIHGGVINNSSTSIAMSTTTGQADRILMTANSGATTVTAELDATINRFTVSRDVTVQNRLNVGEFITAPHIFLQERGEAPNLFISSGTSAVPYNISRTTFVAASSNHSHSSTARYKEDITDIAVDELDPRRLLDLPVRQFHFNRHVDWRLGPDDPVDPRWHPGFIAEELEEIYPIAVEYGADGLPENYYDRKLIPGMLALIQDLHRRVVDLEGMR